MRSAVRDASSRDGCCSRGVSEVCPASTPHDVPLPANALQGADDDSVDHSSWHLDEMSLGFNAGEATCSTDATNADRRQTGTRYERLHRFLEDAQTFDGVDPADVSGMHSRIRADERVFLCVQGATLIAPPNDTRTQGPQPIDQGEFVVTTARAIFTGTKQIRQWSWAQLVDIEHSDRGAWTSIQVVRPPKNLRGAVRQESPG